MSATVSLRLVSYFAHSLMSTDINVYRCFFVVLFEKPWNSSDRNMTF